MKLRLRSIWERITGGLWFLPSLIVAASMVLAVAMLRFEGTYGGDWELGDRFPRLFGADAESSREMLSTIAGSIATIAGVTFSITVLAVSQASLQYTPRTLRNFMRDRSNQATLGIFIGIFAYSLIVLRTVRGREDFEFIPSISVLLGFVLVLVGMGVLIYFIHHIANSLQASTIVHRIERETIDAVANLFPEQVGEEPDETDDARAKLEELQARNWYPIPAVHSGYIQFVDGDGLLELATELGTVIRMELGIGEFVIADTPLVSVCDSVDVTDELVERLNDLFPVASFRTVKQDAAYGLRQLADIAAKALSPSVNDASTAITSLDYSGAILTRLASRRMPSRIREADGEVRVIARGTTFQAFVRTGLDDIRRNAGGQVGVLLRLVRVLETIAVCTRNDHRRDVLREQVQLVLDDAERSVSSPDDLRRIREEANRVLGELDAGRAAFA